MTRRTKEGGITLQMIDFELESLEVALLAKGYPRASTGFVYRWLNTEDGRIAIRIETVSISDTQYVTDRSVYGALAKARNLVDSMPPFQTSEQAQRDREIRALIQKARDLGLGLEDLVQFRDEAA